MFDSRCQNAGLEWARAATGSDGSRPQCPDHLCYRLSRRATASASDWWGAICYLPKPCNDEELLGCIRLALERSGPSRTLKNSVLAKQNVGSSKVTLA